MRKRSLPLFLILVLLLAASSTHAANPSSRSQPLPPHPAQAPVIVDHTTTDLGRIPPYWIEQAKALLRLSYGHTSHGSQIVSGMQVLMDDPANGGLYDFNTNGAVVPGVLSLADTTPSGDLGNPDRVTWAALTRDYLNTPGNDRNVVVWSWCGQVSSATPADITTYLTLMDQLEQDFPAVDFVYMTGHLDGSGVDGNLNQRNNQIRDYVRANNKILFDFADIESYDPDGDEFLSRLALDTCYYDGNGNGNPWDDTTNWAIEWCGANPGDARCATCGCAHSEPLNCNLKARAFWWLLARLAGWPGPAGPPDFSSSNKQVSVLDPALGDTVDYTLRVANTGGLVTPTVSLTDVVPAGLAYVPGSLAATSGTADDSAAPTLHWAGALDPDPAVTITYAVTVTVASPQRITNTASISVPGYATFTRTATVWANWQLNRVYLPLVGK
jgi:uncharacterized repeat protein (TIGR01451 family)